jgi:hypothetical protein
MEALSQVQQAATITICRAREHYGEAAHEKARSHACPSPGIEVTRHAKLNEMIFVVPIDASREVAIRCRIGRSHFEHAQACANHFRQRSQRFEIAALSTAKT